MNTSKRVLVVEDEKSIRKFLFVSLTSFGYEVLEAVDGEQAVNMVQDSPPQIIILDLGLPGIDGYEVIHRIRQNSTVPIIVLTVRDHQEEKIRALNLGADDYLTKPFGIDELNARLKAILRRVSRGEDETVFCCGDLRVDITMRLVTIEQRNIELSPTEYNILTFLIQNAGKVLTHGQIIKKIWGKNIGDYESYDHLLRVTISNMRSKLEPDPSKPAYILTEPAVGYRLKYQESPV